MNKSKLPPLPPESFDGEKEQHELVENLKCVHDMYYVTASDIQCRKCGVGYTGANIDLLFDLLKPSS